MLCDGNERYECCCLPPPTDNGDYRWFLVDTQKRVHDKEMAKLRSQRSGNQGLLTEMSRASGAKQEVLKYLLIARTHKRQDHPKRVARMPDIPFTQCPKPKVDKYGNVPGDPFVHYLLKLLTKNPNCNKCKSRKSQTAKWIKDMINFYNNEGVDKDELAKFIRDSDYNRNSASSNNNSNNNKNNKQVNFKRDSENAGRGRSKGCNSASNNNKSNNNNNNNNNNINNDINNNINNTDSSNNRKHKSVNYKDDDDNDDATLKEKYMQSRENYLGAAEHIQYLQDRLYPNPLESRRSYGYPGQITDYNVNIDVADRQREGFLREPKYAKFDKTDTRDSRFWGFKSSDRIRN